MEAVIILGEHNHLEQARALLAAGRAAGADSFVLLRFGGDADSLSALPVERIIVFVSPLRPDDAAREAAAFLAGHEALILCWADCFGHEVSVHLAFQLNQPVFSRVTALCPQSTGLRVRRRIYGLRLEGDFWLPQGTGVLSIERDSFPPVPDRGNPGMDIRTNANTVPWYHQLQSQPYQPEATLANCPVVFIGGRGLGSRETAEKLIHLADRLKAGVGATRPAVQNGWFPENCLVGASGAQIAPEECITFGVSGCAALMLGIRHSHRIWAINTDPQAPIFSACTQGTLASCDQVIDALIRRFEG